MFYTADWNSIKISLAGAYTWLEANPFNGAEEDIVQVGGSILHKPSGLGIYATGNWESVGKDNNCGGIFGSVNCQEGFPPNFGFELPDTSMFGVKPFWRHVWGAANGVGLGALGATTFFAEYAEYYDMYGDGWKAVRYFRQPRNLHLGIHQLHLAASWPWRRTGDRRRRHACLGQMAEHERRRELHGLRRWWHLLR